MIGKSAPSPAVVQTPRWVSQQGLLQRWCAPCLSTVMYILACFPPRWGPARRAWKHVVSAPLRVGTLSAGLPVHRPSCRPAFPIGQPSYRRPDLVFLPAEPEPAGVPKSPVPAGVAGGRPPNRDPTAAGGERKGARVGRGAPCSGSRTASRLGLGLGHVTQRQQDRRRRAPAGTAGHARSLAVNPRDPAPPPTTHGHAHVEAAAPRRRAPVPARDP